MWYLIDFVDTACIVHNFPRRPKIIFHLLKQICKKIVTIFVWISYQCLLKITHCLYKWKFFHGIFWSGNLLILKYSSGIKQSRNSYFQYFTPEPSLGTQSTPWTSVALKCALRIDKTMSHLRPTYLFSNFFKSWSSQDL